MSFTGSVDVSGMRAFNDETIREIGRRQRKAISVGGEALKKGLRDQTRPQLGERVAKTWRMRFYGMRGEESPAAFAWSKAPQIVRGHQGATIVPIAGSRMLALPTERVPRRRGGRGAKGRMSPEEVEAHYNQDLIIRRGKRSGTLIGLIDLNASAIRGRRRSRKQRLVHMFTFTPRVRLPRRINPDAAFLQSRRLTKRVLQEG